MGGETRESGLPRLEITEHRVAELGLAVADSRKHCCRRADPERQHDDHDERETRTQLELSKREFELNHDSPGTTPLQIHGTGFRATECRTDNRCATTAFGYRGPVDRAQRVGFLGMTSAGAQSIQRRSAGRAGCRQKAREHRYRHEDRRGDRDRERDRRGSRHTVASPAAGPARRRRRARSARLYLRATSPARGSCGARLPGVAPSAVRIPISAVRWLTTYDSTP